ncbi:MAG TPA: DUF4097 family beta strand repeat-containing protein [Acidimicrobiales bacterium]|nr:DUF4097 family beta strand repeat-containing protein [Acidimicrobiales bacterium]
MTRPFGRLAWGSVGGLLTLVLVGWGAFNVTNLLAHGQESEVHRFDATEVQRLDVQSASGDITVIAADVDTVTVTADISTSIGRTAHDEALVDGTLELHSGCPWFSSWCSVDYTVIVPPSVELDVHTGNGAVLVRASDAPVTAHSGNGHIELVDLSGPIRATAGNGSLEGRDLRATDVDASTNNGHLELGFAVPVHRVRARTGNGWLEVHVPDRPGAYRVDATTRNGSRTVAVRTDPTGTDTIDVATGNGHLQVDYRSP